MKNVAFVFNELKYVEIKLKYVNCKLWNINAIYSTDKHQHGVWGNFSFRTGINYQM